MRRRDGNCISYSLRIDLWNWIVRGCSLYIVYMFIWHLSWTCSGPNLIDSWYKYHAFVKIWHFASPSIFTEGGGTQLVAFILFLLYTIRSVQMMNTCLLQRVTARERKGCTWTHVNQSFNVSNNMNVLPLMKSSWRPKAPHRYWKKSKLHSMRQFGWSGTMCWLKYTHCLQDARRKQWAPYSSISWRGVHLSLEIHMIRHQFGSTRLCMFPMQKIAWRLKIF